MYIKTTITTATAALALSLSSAAMADEVYSETATGMAKVAIQAICDGDKERHLGMHNVKIHHYSSSDYDEKFAAFHELCQEVGIKSIETDPSYPEAFMQQHKRSFPVYSKITMGNGDMYSFSNRANWGTFRAAPGKEAEAWRLGDLAPSVPNLITPLEHSGTSYDLNRNQE